MFLTFHGEEEVHTLNINVDEKPDSVYDTVELELKQDGIVTDTIKIENVMEIKADST